MPAKKTKKPSAHAKRLAAQRARKTETVELPDGPAAPPPSPAAVAAYVEVLQWAAESPDDAADLGCLHETDWAGPMHAIAFPDRYSIPESQHLEQAWRFRAWHILNGLYYTLDWDQPVAEMTPDEIISALRADGVAGKVLPPL